MSHAPTNLTDLLQQLRAHDQAQSLVFTTDEGDIGAGYHVTELKHQKINSIDCGARLANWDESLLQLLDGQTGQHMTVRTFAGIARQSAKQLPGLGAAPLFVEYAPSNKGLRRYHVQSVEPGGSHLRVTLSEDRARCKPAATRAEDAGKSACCGSAAGKSTCCT